MGPGDCRASLGEGAREVEVHWSSRFLPPQDLAPELGRQRGEAAVAGEIQMHGAQMRPDRPAGSGGILPDMGSPAAFAAMWTH